MSSEMSYDNMLQADTDQTMAWFEDKSADTHDSRQQLLRLIVDFEPELSFSIDLANAINNDASLEVRMALREFDEFIKPQGHSGASFGMMMRLIQRHYRD